MTSVLKVNTLQNLNSSTIITQTNATTITISADNFVGVFPAGTKMLFIQTTAPTGWTKDTTHDNKALRVVSGAASSGGTVGFTTAFASQAVSGTVGNTTLTTAQIPSHTHSFHTQYNLSGGPGGFNGDGILGAPSGSIGNYNAIPPQTTGAAGGGTSHNHSFTGTAINLAVTYVDTIIAAKN